MPKDRYPKTERRTPTAGGHRLHTSATQEVPLPEVIPRDLEEDVRRLAPSRATVLILGGDVGLRAAIARALHDHSGRARGPFVAVDCSALTPEDAERILFGGPHRTRSGGAALA